MVSQFAGPVYTGDFEPSGIYVVLNDYTQKAYVWINGFNG